MAKKNNNQANEEKKADEALQLKQRLEDLEGQFKRALADYQNLEKRIKDDKINWIQNANKDLIYRLLPVLDTLILAAKHTEDQGIKMTLSQFMQVLEAEGVKRINTVGEIFSPEFMEAVDTVEGEENKVIEEVRAGIMLNGKVLRPAQVKVGKNKN